MYVQDDISSGGCIREPIVWSKRIERLEDTACPMWLKYTCYLLAYERTYCCENRNYQFFEHFGHSTGIYIYSSNKYKAKNGGGGEIWSARDAKSKNSVVRRVKLKEVSSTSALSSFHYFRGTVRFLWDLDQLRETFYIIFTLVGVAQRHAILREHVLYSDLIALDDESAEDIDLDIAVIAKWDV